MPLTLTYDPVLSRVRVAFDGNVLTNSGFEVDTAHWTAQGGTFARSTAQHRTGVASGLLTPNGVTSIVLGQLAVLADFPRTVPGQQYQGGGWFFNAAGLAQVSIAMTWWDAAGVAGTTSASAITALPANTWTQYSVTATAPAGAVKGQLRSRIHGTPPVSAVMYHDDMRIYATAAAKMDVHRSLNSVNWTAVRGGLDVPLINGTTSIVDDYEFWPDVPVRYRIRVKDAAGVVLSEAFEYVTPSLGGQVWLKSLTRPFLNRAVELTGAEPEFVNPARNGVFPVIGRSYSVAVTDVRPGESFELEAIVKGPGERSDLKLLFASGDPLFLQVPSDHCVLESTYVVAGDIRRRRQSVRANAADTRHLFTMPFTEVAPPGPDVIGATVTYQSLLSAFSTYEELLDAETSYASVLERIGDPSDVIVP